MRTAGRKAGGFSYPAAEIFAPGIRPARRKRERLHGGIIGDAHPRSARPRIDDAVRERRQTAIRLTRQHQNAARTRNTRAAGYVRQLISNANAERLAGTFRVIAWVVEQCLGLVIIDDFNRIGLKSHANASRACGRPGAPQPLQFGRRVRRPGAGCRSGPRR